MVIYFFNLIEKDKLVIIVKTDIEKSKFLYIFLTENAFLVITSLSKQWKKGIVTAFIEKYNNSDDKTVEKNCHNTYWKIQ